MKTIRLLAALATGSLFFASGAKVSAQQVGNPTNVIFPNITYGETCQVSAIGGALAVSGNSKVISSDPAELTAAAGAGNTLGTPSPMTITANSSLSSTGYLEFSVPQKTGSGTDPAESLVKVNDAIETSLYSGTRLTKRLDADGSLASTTLNVKFVNNNGFKAGTYGATVFVTCFAR